MPAATTPPPTLLSLTAPAAQRPPSKDGADAGFAETLRGETGAEGPAAPAAGASDDSSAIDDAESAGAVATPESDEKVDQQASVPSTEDPTEAAEAALLSVVPAFETIVAETAPTAVLPEAAATVVDATLTAPAESLSDNVQGSVPIDPIGAPSSELESQSTIDPDAAETIASTPIESELVNRSPDVAQAPEVGGESPGQAIGDSRSDATVVAPVGGPSARPDGQTPGGDRQPLPAEAAETPADAADAGADGEGGEPAELENVATKIERVETSVESAPNDGGRTGGAADGQPREAVTAPAAPTVSRVEGPGSSRSAAPTPPMEIDPARFVSRVSRAVELASERGGGPVEMRLSPPELGSMQVKIEVREGVLTAQIETETQSARNALLDNLPALRERLEQQQIRIEQFNVDVRDEGRAAPDFGRSDERASEEAKQPSDQRSAAPHGDPESTPAERAANTPLLGSDGRINVMA